MEVYLNTDRLVLRLFTEADVDNLIELDGDPAVMRFISGGRATPRAEIERQVLPAFLRYYEESAGHGFWAAVERASGEFIGWFHLRPQREGGRADEPELGYRLRRSSWGRGYATEGAQALIQKGFTELGARRIFAETMSVNTASRRVMEKAGLRFVRTFHQPWPDPISGDEHGDVEYALTRDEWMDSRSRREPEATDAPDVASRGACKSDSPTSRSSHSSSPPAPPRGLQPNRLTLTLSMARGSSRPGRPMTA